MKYTIRIGYKLWGDSYVFEQTYFCGGADDELKLHDLEMMLQHRCTHGFQIEHLREQIPRIMTGYVSVFVPPAAILWGAIREALPEDD